MIQTSRRSFITGLVSFVAAPAIVRAGSLMPVKVMEPSILDWVKVPTVLLPEGDTLTVAHIEAALRAFTHWRVPFSEDLARAYPEYYR